MTEDDNQTPGIQPLRYSQAQSLSAAGLFLTWPFDGIDVERLAGAVGDVAEVAEHGALVAFFDGAVQLCAVADGVDEVCRGARLQLLVAFFVFVDELAVGVEESVAAVFEEDRAGVAAEFDVDSAQRFVGGRPADAFPDERAAAVEVGDDVARVGRLLIVVVAELAAGRR